MKNIRLQGKGKLMTTPQHVKCKWCEYGVDTYPAPICIRCYAEFKDQLSSQRWRILRRYYLVNIDTAYCNNSLNCHPIEVAIAGEVIDHIKPWCLWPSLFWEPENHQTLCCPCHSKKTQFDGSLNFSPRKLQ